MNNDIDLIADAILLRAEYINTVVVAGVLLSATVFLIRRQGGTQIELLNVALPIRIFPVVCVGYTIAHAYCTFLFALICHSNMANKQLWYALTLKGPLIFNGMMSRETIMSIETMWGIFPLITYIPLIDPTTWLFYLFCIAVYFGFSRSCELANYGVVKSRIFVFLLIITNWIIGTVWTVSASMLAT